MDKSFYAVEEGEPQDYYYFMKLVPHNFRDRIAAKSFNSYSYSLNHNMKKAMTQNQPYISIIYDFSPVTMKLTKEKRDFSRFAINLCAIVGGIFVIFGLVNRFVLKIKRSVLG